MNRKETTQVQTVKKEIMNCLDNGMTSKQEIYNTVCTITETPRPTVRRVASALKKEIQSHYSILADTRHIRDMATIYDCPECKAKNVIKRNDNRCPKCQVILDWSDEQ